MKRYIAYFVGLLLLGYSGAVSAAPIIKVEEPVWNVGTIISGNLYEKVLAIENAGDAPLIIEKVEQCCGFFGKLPGRLRILPGEKASLRLELSPYQMVGGLDGKIVLFSNDPASPQFSISAVGQVVPKLHALGELKERVVDLGVVDLHDRVAFKVRIANTGSVPLEVRQVEKPATVEIGARPVIGPQMEETLVFEYSPAKLGPIEEQMTIITNDTLGRVLVVQLKGYVARERGSDHALSIYPIGKKTSFDVMQKAYRYDITVSNQGAVEVEIVKVESSFTGMTTNLPEQVRPGEAVEGKVFFPLSPGNAGRGYIYLQLAIPTEIR